MIGVLGKGRNSERTQESEKFGSPDEFGYPYRRNVEASGQGFGDGYGSAVGERKILRFVGGSFGGFERNRKVEHGVARSDAPVLEREKVGERLDGRTDLSRRENGVHLSGFRRKIIGPSEHCEHFLGIATDD